MSKTELKTVAKLVSKLVENIRNYATEQKKRMYTCTRENLSLGVCDQVRL